MVHDAMPMWVAPMRFANLMVSCTRVEFAVSSLTIAAACMMTWFSGSAYRRCASSCSADETAPCAQNPGFSRSVYSHAVVPQLMQLSFDSMIPPDWVSRVADMTTNIIRPRSKERGHGVMMERATGLEPADTSLGSWGLTTWRRPHRPLIITLALSYRRGFWGIPLSLYAVIQEGLI